MKALPNVTLIGIDTVDPNRTARVLDYCANLFEFGASFLFSNAAPRAGEHRFELRSVPNLDWEGVQVWEIRDLPAAFETEFCLTVQHDGWILNPHLWDDVFLQYDYIGAPFSPREPYRVGNGGFTLRSRRLCQAVAERFSLRPPGFGLDGFVSFVIRDQLREIGMRYAPLDVAGRFAWDNDYDDVVCGPTTSFGFHGWYPNKNKEALERMLA